MKLREMEGMRRLLLLKGITVLAVIFLISSPTPGQDTGSAGIELQSSLHSAEIRQGESMTITGSVVKGQLVLNSPEVIRYLKMSAYVKQPDGSGFLKALFDNGLDGDVRAGDGLYSCRITAAQAGVYEVRVLVEGKGIRRTQEHTFKALSSGKTADAPAEGIPGQIEDIKAKAEVRHDSKGEAEIKTKAEAANQTQQKFPWLTFGIINAVAAVLWIAAFMVLYLRVRKLRPVRVENKVMNFGKFLREQADEKMKQLASDEQKAQEGATADSKVINELHSARLLFLKGLLVKPDKAEDEMPLLWNQIYKSFDEAIKTVLKDKKTALDKIDVLQDKVEEIGGISEDLKGAKALAEAQARKIAFLMSYKDVIAESQLKFDSLKDKNKDLENKLFDAAQKAGMGEAMKAPLAEFRENYKQLELCVATLEKENERLVEEVGRWQKELDQMKTQGPVMISETPAEVLKENEDLKEMVRDFEASLKAKDKELEEAVKRFESLEAEYMILYQEKQAAQQQPDI
ncbi:MAG: hypothetical protein HZB31_14350 [Nitrospirae bacterium]|nr:hypothetical protein [Nitrospirota bacterium]